MSELAGIRYRDRIRKIQQVKFGGLRHTEACREGELYDAYNLSVKNYPIIGSRPQREYRSITPGPEVDTTAIYSDRGILMRISGPDMGEQYLYYGDFQMMSTPGYHYFVPFGHRVILMPAGILLNTKEKIMGTAARVEDLPASAHVGETWAVGETDAYELYRLDTAEGQAQWVEAGPFAQPMGAAVRAFITVKDGTIYGKPAKANTIVDTSGVIQWKDFFKVGDGIRLEGCTTVPKNDGTYIIREMEGAELRFSDNSFRMPEQEGVPVTEYQEDSKVVLERWVPEGKFWFEHGNRLWTSDGQTIYASKLGDPTNWEVFDGLSTDAWFLETQGVGVITAGCSYRTPVFFRERGIVKAYGANPPFQTHETDAPGVAVGLGGSLGEAGGVLYYMSRDGMMAYSGDYPRDLQQVFGAPEELPERCLTVSDGTDLYAWQEYSQERWTIYHLDSLRGLWTQEEAGLIRSATVVDSTVPGESAIVALNDDGRLMAIKCLPGWGEETERNFQSIGIFREITDFSPSKKGLSELQFRIRGEVGTTIEVAVQYDSDGIWRLQRRWTAGEQLRSWRMSIQPRRCDHYAIRIMATGGWQLHSMARSFYIGSGRREDKR